MSRGQQIDAPCCRCRMGSVAALFLCMLCPLAAYSQPTLEVVGTWGGAVNAVFIDESDPDIAYIGSGRRLVILNVADPANIIELGSVDLGNVVLDLKVKEGFAFVATGGEPNCFCVADVSLRSNPVLVWTNGCGTENRTKEVDLYQDFAYVRDADELVVYDIAQPASPQRRGGGVSASVRSSQVSGDLLYVVDDFRNLRIYDLSANPITPPEIGIVTLPGREDGGTAVAVVGSLAYVTTISSGGVLAIVDVSDPRRPTVLGHWGNDHPDEGDVFFFAADVAVSGTFAYVADWQDGASPFWHARTGLKIFDVSDPDAPVLHSTYRTHASVMGIEVVGSRAYVGDEGEGLIVLDLSDPAVPTRIGNYHSPRDLRKMAKSGDLLYVTDELNGISILDVSQPDRPRLVGVYQSSESSGRWGDNWDVEVRAALAYLSAGYGGLEVVDVRDPANPSLAGSFPFNSNQAIALKLNPLHADIAHVGVKGAWIVNFDISDPGDIREVASLHLGGSQNEPYALDISSSGVGHCAVTLLLAAADLSDPDAPSLIGTQPWPFASWPYELVLRGNLRYVTHPDSDPARGAGLWIQDVSDPAAPLELSRFPAHYASSVAVQNGLAYMVATLPRRGYHGLSMIDVAEPSAPALLADLRVPSAKSVLADGRHLFVACEGIGGPPGGGPGLVVLAISGLPTPGDLNCDGSVDLTDVGPFITALLDPQEYENQYPDCDIKNGDTNHDGSIDLSDVEPFIELLIGP